MTTPMDSTLGRDPFMPTRPKGRGPALVLAVLAHVLLILALAFGVNWRNTEPASVVAELWSAVPQAAAPRAAEPPPAPPPPEPKKVEPVVKAAEPVAPAKPPTPALPDPQIAIEKAKRDEARRALAEQEAQKNAQRERAEREQADQQKQQRLKEELAQKKAAADKLKAEQAAKATQAEQAEAAREALIRDQNIKRMQGMAGASGGPADTGTAMRSSGPSDSYAGRIVARIKPNIVFNEPVDGNPVATVEVKLAPDGTIVAKHLLKSSGNKAWDDAVLRAIERTEVLPRDVDGRVPPPFPISFRLRD